MRSVELFAGAGGLGLGLSSVGFRPAMVLEWDSHCCRTLRDNQARGIQHIARWNIVEADARAIDFQQIGGDIDLVSGGPPCQPFSIGGKHKGQNDHRNMWPEAARAVRELAPSAFLFENVRGLMRPAFVPYLRYIELQLTYPELAPRSNESWEQHAKRLDRHHSRGIHGLTYRVHIQPVDAADYGAAQKRRRVIIIGFRNDEAIDWRAPRPTHSQEALLYSKWISGDYWDQHRVARRNRGAPPMTALSALSRLSAGGRPRDTQPWRTVRDAIGDLPRLSKLRETFPNHRYQPGAKSYVGHTGSLLDEPAKALKAGDHGVPGGENMLASLDGSVRYFSVREAARLQGFPDDFIFPNSVSWTESMRQLGNAVPTQLATAFGGAIIDSLRAVRNARLRQAA